LKKGLVKSQNFFYNKEKIHFAAEGIHLENGNSDYRPDRVLHRHFLLPENAP